MLIIQESEGFRKGGGSGAIGTKGSVCAVSSDFLGPGANAARYGTDVSTTNSVRSGGTGAFKESGIFGTRRSSSSEEESGLFIQGARRPHSRSPASSFKESLVFIQGVPRLHSRSPASSFKESVVYIQQFFLHSASVFREGGGSREQSPCDAPISQGAFRQLTTFTVARQSSIEGLTVTFHKKKPASSPSEIVAGPRQSGALFGLIPVKGSRIANLNPRDLEGLAAREGATRLNFRNYHRRRIY